MCHLLEKTGASGCVLIISHLKCCWLKACLPAVPTSQTTSRIDYEKITRLRFNISNLLMPVQALLIPSDQSWDIENGANGQTNTHIYWWTPLSWAKDENQDHLKADASFHLWRIERFVPCSSASVQGSYMKESWLQRASRMQISMKSARGLQCPDVSLWIYSGFGDLVKNKKRIFLLRLRGKKLYLP